MNQKVPDGITRVRISLQIHADDNVITLLDNNISSTLMVDGSNNVGGIPFGHKVALYDIEKGASVVKYGVVIGSATAAINKGEHVHVHNLA